MKAEFPWEIQQRNTQNLTVDFSSFILKT
jgi:hypothetical protein